MQIEVLADPDAVAARAATLIAEEARTAVARRKRFVMAVSGGHTPWIMLRVLAGQEHVPWNNMHVFQVDERVAPQGDTDLGAAAKRYATKLGEIAGSPPTLDLVHLGLGPDGHTASLVPGDAVLGNTEMTVALTGEYQGRRRMTLTYPVLNDARHILWVVTGSDKARILPRLQAGDHGIPAGRVHQHNALILADRAAAGSRRQGA
jgi:6-phosphogluconolactonase